MVQYGEDLPRVVIVGGGFGGLSAAKALRHAPVRVTLIDRNNHHTFQPLLYQVATAAIEANDVGYPLRTAMRRHENTEVLMAEASAIAPEARAVHLTTGQALTYDYLILATGAHPAYHGHPEWSRVAPSLKSIRDAMTIRFRVLTAFERAEQARDPEEVRANLTFVVVGGGATGVELAGAIAELARTALVRDFRRIDTSKARVLLLQGGPSLLAAYPRDLQQKAREQLESLGVEVHTGARVEAVDARGVTTSGERIESRTVLWAAGVEATPITHTLGAPLDRHGKVQVTPTLNPPGRPEVFVVGDLIALEQDGRPLPGLAPLAMQSGRYAAHAIVRRIHGARLAPFHYRNKGELATIGRSRAIGVLPAGVRVTGTLAWLAYLGVHIFYLAGVRNRASVLLSWAWTYLTYSRGARIIPSTIAEPGRDTPASRAVARPATVVRSGGTVATNDRQN